jgi:hypothetical protein
MHACDPPGEEKQALVHVGQGEVAGLDPARGEKGRQSEVAAEHSNLLNLPGALLIREKRLYSAFGLRISS